MADGGYAWFLATCPNDHFRNGTKAVELAKKSLALRPDDPATLDTLAAAYAETGQFDLAVEAQKKALGLLKEPTEEGLADYRARLESYENQKPWRETFNDQ